MSAAAGAESVAAAAQMNDPKSEDSEKSCENKSGEERERRENKQSEPFVCLYLTAATDEASVRRRKISGEEKREREEGEAGRGGGGGAPLQ